MPIPWLARFRQTKKLTVFNKANGWKNSVSAAMRTFNGLQFRVKLAAAKSEASAEIVLVDVRQYKYQGTVLTASPDFTETTLHGEFQTLENERPNEIFFAVVFLPEKLRNPTARQNEMVVVHELIHACGITQQEHDSAGIIASHMQPAGSGLKEWGAADKIPAMPPVRVGPQTLAKMNRIWN
jgi:hypothetical protein